MKRAAFFDFDKTLITDDSQAIEGRYITQKKKLSPLYMLRIAGALCADLLNKYGKIEQRQSNAWYLNTYKGIKLAWLERAGISIYHDQLQKLYDPTVLKRLEMHRNEGYITAIVTATSEHLVLPALNELKADYILPTRIETDKDGYCTGRALGRICIGDEKRKVIQSLAEQEGISLKDSWAYSDHHADIGFLEAVGNPVAVNPTEKLLETAKKRNWEILITTP